jgi:hypothetical protein
MHRTAALLVAAGLAALGIIAWASPAQTQTGPALIRITSTQKQYVRVNAAPGNAGDIEMISQRLYNKKITKNPIGRAEVVCMFTFGTQRTCRNTYFLAEGKIVVGGSITNRDIYELAILGGTGLYNNARGTFTSIRTAKSPRKEFLIFRLAG